MSKASAVLINRPGPLPIVFEYTPKESDQRAIVFSASRYKEKLGLESVGFELLVNGRSAGKSEICSEQTANQEGEKQPTIATMVNFEIPVIVKNDVIQPIIIEIMPLNSEVITDQSDRYNISVFSQI